MFRLMNMVVQMRPFEEAHFKKLLELARAQFDPNITEPEAQVLVHSSAGYPLPTPPAAGPHLPIRAEFLRWLLTDTEAAKHVDPKGVRVWSAHITDPLDLQGCSIPHQVYLHGCIFEQPLGMFASDIEGLYMLGGELKEGLLADSINVHGPVFIKHVKCAGGIHLVGSDIGRNIDMTGTEITATGMSLVLDGAKIRGSAFFHDRFRASGEVRMLNAKVGGDLGFRGATLSATDRAISLDKIAVEGNVSFANWIRSDGTEEAFHSDGSVNLLAARIEGDLDCQGADLAATDISLNLSTAKIRGHVYLRGGFRAKGTLLMHSAEVGNSIDFSGAKLTGATRAICLEAATVRGTISICDQFSSHGRIEVQYSHIDGNLVCDNSRFAALYCANMTLKGDLQWTGIQEPEKTSLWLNGASVKNVRDERESWPKQGDLHLDGLQYVELTLHTARTEADLKNNSLGPEHELKVGDRVAWLKLQPQSDLPEPQPWMHLATVLRAKGDDDGAKQIIFELRRVKAKPSNPVMRLSKVLFAKLQQQPLWILLPIILTTSLATGLFGVAGAEGAMAPTNKDAYVAWAKGTPLAASYPRFNPFVYSLENDLPLLKLGFDEKWAPDQNYQAKEPIISYGTLRWARVFVVLLGWFQATVLAAAIGLRFKN
jgi:hypothetical protein